MPPTLMDSSVESVSGAAGGEKAGPFFVPDIKSLQPPSSLVSPPPHFDYFRYFQLSTHLEKWSVWYRYEYKHKPNEPKKGREITNIDIDRYMFRLGAQVWGPVFCFLDIGFQGANVTYDKIKRTDPFNINMGVDTIAPTSVFGVGSTVYITGQQDRSFFANDYLEFSVEPAVNFAVTHREVAPDHVVLKMGKIHADLTGITDHYINVQDINYQIAYARVPARGRLTYLSWLQPFVTAGPNLLDVRFNIPFTSPGKKLLQKGKTTSSEVNQKLGWTQFAGEYGVGVTSNLPDLFVAAVAFMSGFGVYPKPHVFSDLDILGSYQWGAIPESAPFNGGRSTLRAKETITSFSLGYHL